MIRARSHSSCAVISVGMVALRGASASAPLFCMKERPRCQAVSSMVPQRITLPPGAISAQVFERPRSNVPLWIEQPCGVVEAPLLSKVLFPGSGFTAVDVSEKMGVEDAVVDAGFTSPMAPQSERQSVLRFPPGLPPSLGTPSRGSMMHASGTCQPCAWFWRSSGCKNGIHCSHCHLCPESELKARKKAKVTMMRLGLVTPKSDAKPSASEDLPRFGWGLKPSESPERCSESETTVGFGSDRDRAVTPSYEDASSSSSTSPSPFEIDDPLPTPVDCFVASSAAPQRQVQTSKGSTLHGTGTCQPCAWFWKPSSCLNAADCKYCHLCPEGEVKSRKRLKLAALRSGAEAQTPKAGLPSEKRIALSLTEYL